jgi:transposase
MSSKYSSQFRLDAVKLAIESDQSVAQIARNLEINANTLYTWIAKYHSPESALNKGSDDNNPYEELKRLRRQNAQLKEERDILKKAAAYFARNSR